MNTKRKEGARTKANPYFLRVPWNKGGLMNTGPGVRTIDLRGGRRVCYHCDTLLVLVNTR